MAELVFTNAYVIVNSVELSDHVRSVTLKYDADMQDQSAMGDTTKVNIAGLKNWSFDFEFNQDYAAGSVDATLFPLVGGSAVTVEVRPVNSGRSSTNPGYNGSAICSSYNPTSGKHGEIHTAQDRLGPSLTPAPPSFC